ncbi:exodeoxyribonuclease VII small subunit [Actinotalea ferrariae CF5-4]|uniref:Exodeoxyribonuclease 7 small subunit n=1 Tax=Actinotalea ferrariae CF5-4 TaxID=948458 RepID=A0A021VRC5_9CELL|nr:exodeoxyribonuclease VII small subunit [Actinotalea ferrariae]EYR63673.1 exodeoxyribonuclease VII small subunit [Actinotalea ferrariae CF5-4]
MPTDSARPTQPTPVADLSYEQAREELASVVSRLETGGETLEGSLALWERGEALAQRCQEWLDGARRRLDAARTAPTGGAGGSDSTDGVAQPTSTDSTDRPTDPEDLA